MPPPPCTCADARPRPRSAPRPLAVIDAEIHRLVSRGPLADKERVRLAGLYEEWLAVAEVGLAA